MTSTNPQTALLQAFGVLAVPVVLMLLLAVGTAVMVRVRARRASRARLAKMPRLAPEALDAGCRRLLAAIPQQRTGAER